MAATITQFLTEHGLTRLPVYLLGTSSGGTMALKLMQTLEEAARKAGVDLRKQPQEGDPFVLRIAGIISGGRRAVGSRAEGRVCAGEPAFAFQKMPESAAAGSA